MQRMLNIDDDVLAAAEERAAAEQKSVDEVLSAAVRRGIEPAGPKFRMRNGVPLLPSLPGDRVVTSEMVYRLQEELP